MIDRREHAAQTVRNIEQARRHARIAYTPLRAHYWHTSVAFWEGIAATGEIDLGALRAGDVANHYIDTLEPDA